MYIPDPSQACHVCGATRADGVAIIRTPDNRFVCPDHVGVDYGTHSLVQFPRKNEVLS